jgi:hypothetical protein
MLNRAAWFGRFAGNQAALHVAAVSAFPGPELVTGGDFSSSSGWTLDGFGVVATISGGTLNGSGTGEDVSWGGRLAAGTLVPGTYRAVFDYVSGAPGNGVRVFLGASDVEAAGATFGTIRSAAGTYSQDIVVASVAGQWLGIEFDTSAANVDNFSVKQIA